jgi:hypothetical protein
LISVGELFRLVAANACYVTVIKNKSVVRVAIDKIYNFGFLAVVVELKID